MALNKWDRSVRLYSAAAVRLSGRPASGEAILEPKSRMLVLISSDTSSLVVDRLCDKVKEQNTAVACSTLISRRGRSSLRQIC